LAHPANDQAVDLDTGTRRIDFATAFRALPTAAVAALAAVLAWREQGSISSKDWVNYAVPIALILAAALLSGAARRPRRAAVATLGALVAFAAWSALSLAWTPLPTAGRDEVLLTLLYAAVFAVPVVTLRTSTERLAAVSAVTLVLGAIAVGAGVDLLLSENPLPDFRGGRLYAPLTYVNAQAALFLVGLWPALVLASRRASPPLLRALFLAAAVAMVGGWAMTQSKGALAGLAVAGVALFALCPARLRLVPPAVIVAGVTAAAFGPLTVPVLETRPARVLDAIDAAATAQLLATAAAFAIGLLYAFVDGRLQLSPRTRRAAGVVVLAGAAAAAAVAVVVAVSAVGDPASYARDKWEEFKTLPERETEETHLTALGSNRYDFWRVALTEFADHPVGGIGTRGWSAAYLVEGESDETPARSHSLVLDVLSETGLVGGLLLLAALAIPVVAMARRLDRVPTAAAFGGVLYWIVHAAGDWTWTFAAAGIPFFLLLGIPLASARTKELKSVARLAGGSAALVLALLVFAPPWLSARLTEQATASGGAAAQSDLRWARRLDPISVEALLAEARLAASPPEAIPPLERAAEKEPRSVGVRYLLGITYLAAGRREDARAELLAAQELFPDDRLIRQALQRAQQGGSGSP
jgi:hypothetical protein